MGILLWWRSLRPLAFPWPDSQHIFIKLHEAFSVKFPLHSLLWREQVQLQDHFLGIRHVAVQIDCTKDSFNRIGDGFLGLNISLDEAFKAQGSSLLVKIYVGAYLRNDFRSPVS